MVEGPLDMVECFAWNWRRPLRGGTEDDQYHRICDIIKQVTIVQTEDSWRLSCDKMDSFSVNGLRKHLDCLALPSHYLATRWNKIVPRKVWNSVVKWLNLNLPFQLPPNELLDFVNYEDNLHKAKDIIFTVIYTVWDGQLTALVAEMEAFDDPGKVFDTLMGLRDDIRVEEAKLAGVNVLITDAEEEIMLKEGQLEAMGG
ncbi:hypothetical protein Tco_0530976 [Tanacetum coccineum]